MKVCLVTATKNRHKHLERLVRFSLDQTSDNWVHLIFNNADQPQRLNNNLPEDKYILINNNTNLKTRERYKTLGEIYQDAIRFVPEDCDLITFMDDDDVFLENHVEEGIKGYEKGGLLAYKPEKSYFRYLQNPIQLVVNTLEPSIFVDRKHVLEHGFSDETTAQHLQWLDPLIRSNQIFVDPDGVPTYICDWSHEIGTFKTSGDPNNPNNFLNYENYSKDSGDGIITPVSVSWGNKYRRI